METRQKESGLEFEIITKGKKIDALFFKVVGLKFLCTE